MAAEPLALLLGASVEDRVQPSRRRGTGESFFI